MSFSLLDNNGNDLYHSMGRRDHENMSKAVKGKGGIFQIVWESNRNYTDNPVEDAMYTGDVPLYLKSEGIPFFTWLNRYGETIIAVRTRNENGRLLKAGRWFTENTIDEMLDNISQGDSRQYYSDQLQGESMNSAVAEINRDFGFDFTASDIFSMAYELPNDLIWIYAGELDAEKIELDTIYEAWDASGNVDCDDVMTILINVGALTVNAEREIVKDEKYIKAS